MNIKEKIDLIKKHLPQFSNSQFHIQNEGWSNQVFFVDDHYVFRFPRTQNSFRDLRVEIEILPTLRHNLRGVVDIPNFEFVSTSKENPDFVGYKMIPGDQMRQTCIETMPKDKLKANAEVLGHFLSYLHAYGLNHDISVLSTKPSQADRWVELKENVHTKCTGVLSNNQLNWIDDLINKLIGYATEFMASKVLLHADFSSDHILLDKSTNTITGVIDFGDLEIGDPALDFTGLYTCYGQNFTEEVYKTYEACNTVNKVETHSGIMERAIKVYSLQPPIHLLLYGVEKNNDMYIQEALSQINKFIEEGSNA